MKPESILKLEKELDIFLFEKGTINPLSLSSVNTKSKEDREYAVDNQNEVVSIVLAESDLTDISFLATFPNLIELNLSLNKINDISPLKNLSKLESLTLWGNDIEDISVIESLKKLLHLDLSMNKIIDISPLRNLKFLKSLDLWNNQIKDIFLLSDFQSLDNLVLFDLSENPIKGTTISNFTDLDAIKGYLNSLKQEKQLVENYDVKINILGTGRIGKTQFFNWLLGNEFVEKEKITHGTGVATYKVPKSKYKASLWDFGGQSYQQGTHSLFLRPKDFYIILYRSNDDDYGYGYWMGASRNFASEKIDNIYSIPLFLVQNVWSTDGDKIIYPNSKKIETYQVRPDKVFNIDVKQFQKDDKEWEIKKILFLESLKKQLIDYAKSFGKIPKKFVIIKDLIELNPFDDIYIKKNDFKKEYAPRYSKTEFAYLLQYLEFTGSIIYFREKVSLEEYVFTNPKVLSDWIYQTVLNEKFLKENKGVLEFKKLVENFGEEKAFVFKELMTDFNLLFEEPDYENSEMNSNLVIPQFLPENNITFKKVLLNLIPFTFSIKFEDFIYEGRIFNFISEYGMYAEDNSSYWKYGILFKYEDIQTIVYYDIHKRIINVHLENKKGYEYLAQEILDYFILKQEIKDYSRTIRVSKFIREKNINLKKFNEVFKEKFKYELRIIDKIPIEAEDYLDEYFIIDEKAVEKKNEQEGLKIGYEKITNFITNFFKNDKRKINIDQIIIGAQLSTNGINYIDVIETIQFENNESRIGYCTESKKKFKLDLLTLKLLGMDDKKLKKVFISYSRQDLKYKDALKSHLSILERYDLVKAWSCEEIKSGKWEKQIQNELEEADIIIYMISHNFMQSSYIMNDEVKKGISLVENDDSKKIICVLTGVCQWKNWTSLEELYKQGKDENGKFSTMDLSQYQFLPYHQYKNEKGETIREEIVALEQWGRYPYDVENVAYNQIVEKVFSEIK